MDEWMALWNIVSKWPIKSTAQKVFVFWDFLGLAPEGIFGLIAIWIFSIGRTAGFSISIQVGTGP